MSNNSLCIIIIIILNTISLLSLFFIQKKVINTEKYIGGFIRSLEKSLFEKKQEQTKKNTPDIQKKKPICLDDETLYERERR